MYKELITEINTILNGVDKIGSVYPYPVKDLKSYPAVVYYPDVTENDWESVKNNLKTYRFKMWVIAEKLDGITEEELFTDILATTVSNIDTALDQNWSLDNAKKTWLKLESGIWRLDKPEDGNITASAELDLFIKTLVSIQ